jgi:hypothetical protein
LWQTKIPSIESKRQYLQLMEEMRERQARQLEGRELDIHIKEMHAHMRDTELKRKKKSFTEVKKLSRRGKNLRYVNESFRNGTRSLTNLLIARTSSVMDGVFYVLLR